MEHEPATKKDIERIEQHIADLTTIVQKSFEAVHVDVQNVRNELKGDIQGVRNELKGDIQGVRNELKGDIQGVRNELKEDVHNVKIEVLESNEKIAKEISDMRAEQAAIVGGRERINDTLLTHGDMLVTQGRRLDRLEVAIP